MKLFPCLPRQLLAGKDRQPLMEQWGAFGRRRRKFLHQSFKSNTSSGVEVSGHCSAAPRYAVRTVVTPTKTKTSRLADNPRRKLPPVVRESRIAVNHSANRLCRSDANSSVCQQDAVAWKEVWKRAESSLRSQQINQE